MQLDKLKEIEEIVKRAKWFARIPDGENVENQKKKCCQSKGRWIVTNESKK